MKIIRYQDIHGATGYAAQQPDGSAHRIEGDVFGRFAVTQSRVAAQRLLAPVPATAFFCIGLNYRRHAEEAGLPVPS